MLSTDAKVGAVIIGVGGFLGVGEKNVAVEYPALQFVTDADNTERFVLNTTKDALQTAPAFTWVEDSPGDANNSSAPADASTDTAMALTPGSIDCSLLKAADAGS